MMNYLQFPLEPAILSDDPGAPDRIHVFLQDAVEAVNAALAARRPLLIQGEPGTGKTQLAAAVALKLGRALVSLTVDSRTESRDLLWKSDAVRRLAQAQLLAAFPDEEKSQAEALKKLDEENFVIPGPIWWGFHWKSATTYAKASGSPLPHVRSEIPVSDDVPDNGCVVLVDEIDKAETDVPNGLLEALGANRFPAPGNAHEDDEDDTSPTESARYIKPDQQRPAPLVIVTTNGERELPDAFLRRCVILTLPVPPEGRDLKSWLIELGKNHFPGINDDLLKDAADMLIEDREACDLASARPGQAEFLDVIRAVREQIPDNRADDQKKLLQKVRKYILQKHEESES